MSTEIPGPLVEKQLSLTADQDEHRMLGRVAASHGERTHEIRILDTARDRGARGC